MSGGNFRFVLGLVATHARKFAGSKIMSAICGAPMTVRACDVPLGAVWENLLWSQ